MGSDSGTLDRADFTEPHDSEVYPDLVQSFHLDRSEVDLLRNLHDGPVVGAQFGIDIRFVNFDEALNFAKVVPDGGYEVALGVR